MHPSFFLSFALFLASVAVAQRGLGGECRGDNDCIRCVGGVTPLICKTDSTSTTGKRCATASPPCQPFFD
uniref:EC18 protein n=1 Tax=Colletotrichum higginsianum TaxID=80884 RepID=I2G791_9PEZI|nr:EC18 protein [Colletotrichum higginsianum]